MFLKPFQVVIPPTILYGPGCLQNLGAKVKPLGKKALIVTDEIMCKVGYVDKVKEILLFLLIMDSNYTRIKDAIFL